MGWKKNNQPKQSTHLLQTYEKILNCEKAAVIVTSPATSSSASTSPALPTSSGANTSAALPTSSSAFIFSKATTSSSLEMTAKATPRECRLLERRMGGGSRQPVESAVVFNLKDELLKLATEDRVTFPNSSQFNILQYWENRRFLNPELYKLSKVILSIPSTQVSVERSFSALALISHLRTKMSSETINDVMIVKQNIDLLDSVNFV